MSEVKLTREMRTGFPPSESGFASCQLTFYHQITPRPPTQNIRSKMSGAGYDVVVDVDEEVNPSWTQRMFLSN